VRERQTGGRRPTGALERQVLDVLWAAEAPQTPAQVRSAVGDDLAYTTVTTILVRLWQKGVVQRHRIGRAYAYGALVSSADFTAQRMHVILGQAVDRAATLARFVNTLPKREARVLRRMFDEESPP